MSSVLAVHPGSDNFDFTASQARGDRCSANRPSHTIDSREPGIPSWFQGGLPTPPGTKDMTGVSLNGNHGAYSQPQQYYNGYSNGQSTQPYNPNSRIPSDAYSNSKQALSGPISKFDFEAVDKSNANTIASHLQIPESVNKSKGSLAEFAAEITCLFWFEDASTLSYAEKLPIELMPNRGLTPDATPSYGFKKWVTTILSTTQVGKNVILLALMFIYRLKKFNPSVSGKRGSEFRLLTIALMLGNKFLDDNTYTNKTWAEVSGISVTEIHIMEVEFLSNMRYELYASESDWARWKTLLGRFGAFYEKASRFQLQASGEQKPDLSISPTSHSLGYKLPSPPSGHFNPAIHSSYHNLPNPMTTLPPMPRSPARHYVPVGLSAERKRSLDQTDFPPAKRLHYSTTPSNVPSPAALTPSPGSQPDTQSAQFSTNQIAPLVGARVPQLPMPRLPPTTTGSGTHLAPLTLPSARSMASIYPTSASTVAWSQPTTPISALQPAMNGQFQNGVIPVTEGIRSSVGSAHTSPINLYGPGTPTRQGLSPSYFLTNRSSPYRPVRNVNTLLIPPPSTTMHNPVRNIGYEQMHYQPLGRPTERRNGPVPYYQTDGWNHSTASTPTGTLYRPF